MHTKFHIGLAIQKLVEEDTETGIVIIVLVYFNISLQGN
jgi:hypothetical protein